MKFGPRKPSLKRSIKARTTGRAKRTVKKAIIPGYGKKGMGLVTNPKKSLYNKVYNKTTFGGLSSVNKNTNKRNTKRTRNKKISEAEKQINHLKQDWKNNLRIYNDSQKIFQKTVNPEVFFERYWLAADKLAWLINTTSIKGVSYEGTDINAMYEILISEKKSQIFDFIKRYTSFCVKDSNKLKTQKGKINRLEKNYKSLLVYYEYFTESHLKYINDKWSKYINIGEINIEEITKVSYKPLSRPNDIRLKNGAKRSPEKTYEKNIDTKFSKEQPKFKKKIVIWILWLFLGLFGAHRFYVNKKETGLLLMVSTFISFGLIGSIWFLVDAFFLNSWVDQYNAEKINGCQHKQENSEIRHNKNNSPIVDSGSKDEALPIPDEYKKLLNNKGFLFGHIVMLWWIDKYALQKEVPGYFKYRYGLDFNKELQYLINNNMVNKNYQLTTQGKFELSNNKEIIRKHKANYKINENGTVRYYFSDAEVTKDIDSFVSNGDFLEDQRLGASFERNKDYENAIKAYKSAIDNCIHNQEEPPPNPFYRLAVIYRKLKDKDKEIAILEKGINLTKYPGAETTHNKMVDRLNKIKF